MTVKRILLFRRRLDPWILAVALAGVCLMSSVGKAGFVFFVVCGLYLAAIRHRACREMPLSYSLALGGWAVWQIALSFLRGEPIAGNRVLSYAGIEFALVFLPIGACLVRRPADALAFGARAAVLAALVLTPIEYAITGTRVGLGGNEALLAYVVGVAGLAARLPTRRRIKLLPNGLFWTYLVSVPILLSGTRAAMILILMVVLFDLRHLFARQRGRRSFVIATVAGVVAIIGVAAGPASRILTDRFDAGMSEMSAFEETGRAVGSVDVRLAMWSSALKVLAERPLIGVGGTERMERVAEAAGVNGPIVRVYRHLHNVVLDEALSSGLIGVGLMAAVFVTFFISLFGWTRDRVTRQTAIILVAFLLVFGLFHGVLLNEWTLLATFGTMGVMLMQARRLWRFDRRDAALEDRSV